MSQPAPSDGWPDPSPPERIGLSGPYAPGLSPDFPAASPPDASPGASLAPLPAPPPPPPVYPAGAYGAPSGPPGYGTAGYGTAGYGTPGYGTAGYPAYAYLPPPKTNGLAIASLVVSIIAAVGLCAYGFGGLLGVVGAVLGHVGKRQIRERGEGGEGLALAGIIIGWIAMGIATLTVGFILVFFVWAVTAS